MYDLAAILISVVAVSLVSFVGVVFVGLKEKVLRRLIMVFVGLASGTLLGGAFFHLLPEALNGSGNVNTVLYTVIVGIISFFVLEKFLHWRHCHEEECPVHTFAYMSLVGDGVHNLIDGMIIAATFMVGFELGWVTTLAVVLHEIPQEIGDFGILVYGGLGKRKALIFNFLSGLTAVIGAVAVYTLRFFEGLQLMLIPFAAGGFIYIAATDLMPELHKKSKAGESVVQLVSLLFGLGLMAFFASFIAV